MTTYYLMGWQDENDIHAIVDRLATSEINHIRVVLYGRQFDRPWRMPVVNTTAFNMMLNPWVADFPDDPVNPGFDLTPLLLHLKKFFESFEWWKTTPRNDLVTRYTPCSQTPVHYFYQNNNRADDLPAMVTGIEGCLYAVYLPCGGSADVTIADGGYSIELFDPRTGVRSACGDFSGTQWSTQNHADSEDWVYLIKKR